MGKGRLESLAHAERLKEQFYHALTNSCGFTEQTASVPGRAQCVAKDGVEVSAIPSIFGLLVDIDIPVYGYEDSCFRIQQHGNSHFMSVREFLFVTPETMEREIAKTVRYAALGKEVISFYQSTLI